MASRLTGKTMVRQGKQVEARSRRAWRTWLKDHHTQEEGIWLVRYKKHHPDYLSYDAVVEEALCFGWIDSLPRKLDADRTMLWMAPRKKGSNWSRINKARIDKLLETDQMTEAGSAKVEAAKQDGSWNALDAVDALDIPHDLQLALRAHPPAEENFTAFPPSARRGILEWIANAKRSLTRSRRIEETARLARDNIRANQWRGKQTG